MSLDSDILIDRRRLKQRLTLWRVLAIVAVVCCAGLFVARTNRISGPFGLVQEQIARVTIKGFIGDNKARHDLLTKLSQERSVKAVIVAIDSPGGTTTGGEALYQDLRDLAQAKPVTAVFGTAATSAAYLAGIATDHIVARGNTITGSVGVIFQWAEVSDLLSKLGVKVDEIRSGVLKAKPSPFTATDDQTRQLTEELVKESQTWFNTLVVERRKLTEASLDDIKTGRIYTGRQALQIGLIDAIGDEREAIKWLTTDRNVRSGLKVVDWKPEPAPLDGLFNVSAIDLISRLGLSSFFGSELSSELNILKERPLQGLFSIWQP